MRTAIVLFLLTACYTKGDARDQLRELGAPEPIGCVKINGGGDVESSFICTDGRGVSWACDSDGCVKMNGSLIPAEAR